MQILATASYDGTVKVWNVTTNQCLMNLKGQEGIIYALSWAPKGDAQNRLISASSTGQIYIWDASKGKVLDTLQLHTKPILRIEWNKNVDMLPSFGYLHKD